ncbi:MAG: IS1 family transposase [Methanobrevibacter sp.]|jgi:cobalamin biosynthesis Co2+ chelatase CbiK|nr:IS1 family transposase [Candidatus Methanovirga aequatorialis]
MERKKTLMIVTFLTTYIERENLNLRQKNKKLARKTLPYSKKDEWLQYHATLQMADHNFSRPHFSLRKENIQKIKDHVWNGIK